MKQHKHPDIPSQTGTIDDLVKAFEAGARKTDHGHEFWYARDLQVLLHYKDWRKFYENVLTKARIACDESGNSALDHFVQVDKMIDLAKGAQRKIDDYMLSRYACYLIAQNGDARKKPVAFAQTYFAIQTRKQELYEQSQNNKLPQSEDEKRVLIRGQIREHNKSLASAAKNAGVETPQQFSIFQSKGYQGLYGKTVPQIQKHKGLPQKSQILDHMGSTELAANFFRVTQTEEKLRQDQIKGAQNAYETHYEVGRKVREAMLNISGIAPENLPIVDHITQAEKRLATVTSQTLMEADDQMIEDDAPVQIDLAKDLWKYALLIMVQRPNGEISTSDLIKELPDYIAIPDHAHMANKGRKDSKFTQHVRNLKSHQTSSTNFIALGYAEAIQNGFRATAKGRQFVIDFFKHH